jgi:type I restriction enzyme S subunit
LNLKLVGGYVVSMPCFIEQQKIVACLSALDDVIEKKKATLAAWEELKKGLLQQMFV